MSAMLLYILVVGLVARWVIAAWQGGVERQELASRDAQIRQLREEIDALHSELRRVADEHSFMVRLLAERGQRPDGLPPPEPPRDPNPEKP
jgi:hypothetical protein